LEKKQNLKNSKLNLEKNNIESFRSKNETSENKNIIYLPKPKEKIILIRVPIAIAFYSNLQRYWMQRFKKCKNKNLYYESLLKYFIYFNKSKISLLNSQMKRILSLFENLRNKEENDNSETLTLKYISDLSNESSKKSNGFFGLDKIFEHMKNSKMSFSLLKKFAKKKDFLSYSMTKERLDKMLRYVVLFARFFTNYENVNLTITPENYEKLRNSLLNLIKRLMKRNKEKGIKSVSLYRVFLKKKFNNKKNKLINKKINKNGSLKKIKFQLINLSDLDISPEKLNSMEIKLDDEKRKNDSSNNLKNKEAKKQNKIVENNKHKKLKENKGFDDDKDNDSDETIKYNLIDKVKLTKGKTLPKTFILNKTKCSYHNNKTLILVLLHKLNNKLHILVSKFKLRKLSNKKNYKNKRRNIKRKSNNKKLKKINKKKNKKIKNNNDNEKNDDAIIRDIEDEQKPKTKIDIKGQPYFNENLKLRKIYGELLVIYKYIKRNLKKKNKKFLKNFFNKIKKKIAEIKTSVNTIKFSKVKNKINKFISYISNLIDKSNNSLKKQKNNVKEKECNQKSKDVLEDYDFYSSDSSKLNNNEDSDLFGNYL